MPRVVQPGGLSGKMRVRYTARRKLALLASVKRVMEEEGLTLRMAAERLRVSHTLFVRWERQRDADGDPILAMLKKKMKVNHPGPTSQLKPIEVPLLRYIFEQREQGINVETFDLIVKASMICPVFNEKTFVAKHCAMQRFLRAHSIVYRMGTHVSQRNPEEVAKEAADFMSLMRPIVTGPHRDWRFILNMDQTPVYFSMSKKKTLDIAGMKTIHIRTSTNDMKRAIVAVTIAADGTLLPSTVVFKGKRDGRIAKTELKTFSTIHFYKCQDNAWMDEEVMLSWVDDVL